MGDGSCRKTREAILSACLQPPSGADEKLMRVLLVNTSERTGGASIAACRLTRALGNSGVEARLLVRDRVSDNPQVLSLPASPWNKVKFVMERAEIFLSNHFDRSRLFSVDHGAHGVDITRLPAFREADIIHLHWINQGMLSLSDVAAILRCGKPVVWTLHDMWPCTGICHQAGYCDRWLEGCGYCPLIGSRSENDLSSRTYRRKQRLMQQGRIQLVACSSWLADIARRSPITAHQPVASIPNPINTDFYCPQDKREARQRLNLPLDKRILLFVSYRATDKNKGIDYLTEALSLLCQRQPELAHHLCVVPVGHEAESLRHSFACEACPQEYVRNSKMMRDLYNAADLLVLPTLMDNLPNTIVEGMACGVPCVGFEVGGLPQMIAHGEDGYLARLRDAADFAEGIGLLLFSSRYAAISEAARRKAVENYSEKVVARRYIELYQSLL